MSKTTYFQVDDRFYKQKEDMAIRSPLSLVVSNIFVEHFEEQALVTVEQKPSL